MVRKVAILCSGQGNQRPGMFDLVADCPKSQSIFDAAGQRLGRDPRRLVCETAPDLLFDNSIGQILCCTQALAVWAGLGATRPTRAVLAGYSVGELAAWGCAGALSASATLELAERRATIMDAVAPPDGGLAGVIGLRRDVLEAILLRHDAAVAIINDVDSFVIGGREAALEACIRDAAALGAKRAVRIRVAVPSHTKLMAGAVEPFSEALRQTAPQQPLGGYRLLSGVDGDAVWDMETGCKKLARQICTTVNWAACLESCREAGVEVVLELGPGTALSRMAASLFPADRVRSADEFRSLTGLQAWLSRN